MNKRDNQTLGIDQAAGPQGGLGPRSVKLITVHGTGAGDTTATGDRWWQFGSDFISGLCQRLDLDPARVELLPFQWKEGPNSEEQRRVAARALLKQLQALEQTGVDYYLIGHSHGGSVIYNALLLAVRKKIELKRLKIWCTVGTPFLDYRANMFLFQRLGSMGLTIFSSGIAAALIAGSYWLSAQVMGRAFEMASFVNNFSFALIIYSVFCIAALYLLERGSKSWFSPAQKRQVETQYARSWLGLWHQEDEAISALYNIKGVSGSIIPRSFLQPLVAIAQLVLILGFGIVIASGTLMGSDVLQDVAFWMVAEEGEILPDEDDATFLFLYVGAMLAISFVGVWSIAWGLKKMMWYLGAPLAWILNKIIWNSVRQRAWGDDLVKEDVHVVASRPPGFTRSFAPLPELVAAPLRAHSDGNAISTLNKVRQILGMAGDPARSPNLQTELADSLEWKELIHTSYFDVPEFVDLLAIGMNRAGLADLQAGFTSDRSALDEMNAWLDTGTAEGTTDPAR